MPERILCSLNPYVLLIEGAVILCSIKLSDIHFMLSSMVNVHNIVCWMSKCSGNLPIYSNGVYNINWTLANFLKTVQLRGQDICNPFIFFLKAWKILAVARWWHISPSQRFFCISFLRSFTGNFCTYIQMYVLIFKWEIKD